jgi:peptidoglycan/LPS O-acetylase OafA/YrhL
LIITDLHTWKEPRALALFLHRRWARTLPIYWIVLALVVLAGWSGATIQSMQAYVVFVQNIWQIHPPYFLVAWSLSIEEWFYLIAAFLLSILALWQRPERALLLTLILLIGVPFALRSWLSLTTDWSWNDAIRQYVPLRLDAIAGGVALVWAWRRWSFVARAARVWVAGAVFLAVSYIVAVQLLQPMWADTPWVRVSIIPVMSLCIMGLFPFLAGLQRPTPSVVERGLRWISVLSYPLYLLHYPVRQTVLGLFGAVGTNMLRDVVVTVLFYAGSFWLAQRWHRELEQPMMRLRLRH